MRYLSLFSGVESAMLAWEPLGWKPVAFAEFDSFPSAVLAHHYPDVPNLGDVTKIKGDDFRGTVDLVVGGSPCQGFSIAGRQKGLDDPRSGLALAYVRLLDEIRPKWFVWENVPGVLSTNGGNDFKAFISEITEIGYCCAWRILDAQYVRVDGYPGAIPQRRRRLFVVGHLADWRYPSEVLFEQESLRGDSEESGGERQAVAGASKEVLRESNKDVRSGNAVTLKIRSGCEGGGKGALWQVEKSATLGTNNDQTLFQPDAREKPDASDPNRRTVGSITTDGNKGATLQQMVSGVYAYGIDRAEFNQGKNAKFRFSVCEEVQPTLTSKGPGADFARQVFDMTHANDVIRECGDKVPTLQARMGTGGNQVPIVMYDTSAMRHGKVSEFETSQTLTASMDNQSDIPVVLMDHLESKTLHVYSFDSKSSNSMKSRNPKSGCMEVNVAKTVDTTVPDPAKNQGGIAILQPYCLAENTIGRKPENGGNGNGWQEEISYTLNTVGVHGVTDEQMRVRRLTPLECERLMGFPDDYTKVPYRGKSADDCPDAPRYKACGNSMCVNVMRWIGERIQACEERHGGT